MKSARNWAPAAWAKSIARATRGSDATSRSKSAGVVRRRRRTSAAVRARGARCSALNHPGILTIHDFGRHEGAPYVVAELLEGQNLRERMAGSALPIRKALDYASQLARGLAAAHEKGIVHRDLKPENVFVTTRRARQDPRLRAREADAPRARTAVRRSPAPTLGTEPGMILGTVGYMSPEQVRGLPADHRSDIFSFGAILYEMVTGEQAFRDSTVETLSAILKEEPSELSEDSAKVPARTWRGFSVTVSRRILPSVFSPPPTLPSIWMLSREGPARGCGRLGCDRRTARTSGSRSRSPRLRHSGSDLPWERSARTDPPAPSVAVHRLTDFAGLEEAPAISPDGKSVAFTAYVGDRRQVWVRLIAGGAALQLTRDDADHEAPRWAPDGASLVYYSPPAEGERARTVWEVPALGGSPRRIASAIGGADISHDGTRHRLLSVREGPDPPRRRVARWRRPTQ